MSGKCKQYGKYENVELITSVINITLITNNNIIAILVNITCALFISYAIQKINIEKWCYLILDVLNTNIIENILKKEKYKFIDKYETEK